MRRRRRATSKLIGALAFVVALMAVFAATAAAAGQTRAQVETLGSSASLAGAAGLAVAPSDGNLYVGGSDNASVWHVFKFDPTTGNLDPSFGSGGQLDGTPAGAFVYPHGLATDPASGDLYVADLNNYVVYKFDEDGNLDTSFGDVPSTDGSLHGTGTIATYFNPAGVAVDPANGDLYVADANNSVIAIFSSAGVYKSQFDTAARNLFSPNGVAVDSTGNVYVAGSGQVQKFDSTGVPVPVDGVSGHTNVLDSLGGNAVTVDPANDDVYVDEGSRIAQFDDSGVPIASFRSPSLTSSQGFAVPSGGAKAYASEDSGPVHVFGPLIPSNALTINALGPGAGTGTITCDAGAGPEACQAEYATGTTITIEASTSDPLAAFEGWGGACTGTGSCVISNIAADTTVSATFSHVQHTVSVAVTGSGTGTVSVDHGPISSCTSGTCSDLYNEGDTIVLTATRNGHSAFMGWSGDCTGLSPKCELTVSADASVAAEFTALSQEAVTYTSETPLNLHGVPHSSDYPTAVTVDQSTGEIYVGKYCCQPQAIVKLDPDGTLLGEWATPPSLPNGIGVDSNAHLVYQAVWKGSTTIEVVDDSGNPLSASGFPFHFETPLTAGLHIYPPAIGPDGSIYLADRAGVVTKFNNSDGTVEQQLTCGDCPGQGAFTTPVGVALDANGAIFVADQGDKAASPSPIPARVYKFHPDGTFDSIAAEFPSTATGTQSTGMTLAVNPLTDDVFVGTGTSMPSLHILGFDALGEQFADFALEEFQGQPLLEMFQIAVSSLNGRVYATDTDSGNGILRVFAPDPILQASTEGTEGVGIETATVDGVVNPNGNATTDCHFDYGPTASYGQSVPCEIDPGEASIRTLVFAELSGLDIDATYHYKVSLTTSQGTVSGRDETFSTAKPSAPSAVTGVASSVSRANATLGGSVNPHQGATTCAFEYGTTASYGSSVPCVASPGKGSAKVSVIADLAGLSPATQYHYRLKATNAGGTVSGKDATFTTLADTCQTKASLCPPTQPTPPVPPAPPAPRKPLKCKKGFKKATKHGRSHCVKTRKHKSTNHPIHR